MKSRPFVLATAAMLMAETTPPAIAHDKITGLFEFDQASGSYPNGGVITDRSGTVFGTTSNGGAGPCDGGAGCGTVFSLSPPKSGGQWMLNVLYNFQGGQDGYDPSAQLTLGPNGSLYGYTAAGTYGTVFQLLPPLGGNGPWTFRILYVFSAQNDSNLFDVSSPLIRRGDALYGIASGGSNACGAQGCGSVFRLAPPKSGKGNWAEATLFKFPGGAGSGEPTSIAGPDSSGSFYVTTALGDGAVVQISPPAGHGKWIETVLTTFNGGDDGSYPASLLLARSGALYGIASTTRAGLAFSVVDGQSGWMRTNIANVAHGHYGPDALAAGTDGSLIGTIFGDVDFFAGAVFELTPPGNGSDWTYTELCNFNRGPDRNPINVVKGSDGHLFGVLNGGDSGFGGLFEVK